MFNNDSKKIDRDLFLFLNQNLDNDFLNNFIADDPTVMGFKLTFYNNNINSPLFNESDLGESAFRYINNNFPPGPLGIKSKEYLMLKEFKKSLFDLTEKFPYFIQKVSGLENIYDFQSDISFIERDIEITTLESLDLRVAKMVEFYTQSIFDWEYRRFNLPINLRRFEFTISVFEIRRFGTFIKKIGVNNFENNYTLLNEYLGMYNFTFSDCEFKFGQSNPFLFELDNAQPEYASNKFKIHCGKAHFDNVIQNINLGDDTLQFKDELSNADILRKKNLPTIKSVKDNLTFEKTLTRVKDTIGRHNIYIDESTGRLKDFDIKTLSPEEIRGLDDLSNFYDAANGVGNTNLLSGGFSLYEKIIISIILTSKKLPAEGSFADKMNKILPGFSNNPLGSISDAAQKSSIAAILGL